MIMFEFNVIILKNTAKLRFYFLTAKRVWENIGAKVLNGFISCPMFIPLVAARASWRVAIGAKMRVGGLVFVPNVVPLPGN